MSENNTPIAIRLSITNEIRKALSIAKKRYPTLSDSEILKLGLSKIVTEDTAYRHDRSEIRAAAAEAVGYDYLNDQDEDMYGSAGGTKVTFA